MALTAKKVYAILKRQISDMEAKLNSPVRYRGTVATADLLPLNPDIGDMYNIESKSIYGEAGMNVAWNGVVWDTMGAPVDMSLYLTKEGADTTIQNMVNEYLEKNPVKPGATPEQAQQIEQNKTDIASLKEETGSLKEDLDEMSDSLLKVVKTVKSSNLFDASADYDDGFLSSNYTIIKEGYSALATTGYIKINRCKHITLTRMKSGKERMFEPIVAVGMYDINKQPINYFKNSKNLDYIDIIDKAYYVRVTINKEFCFTKSSIYKPMLSCSTEVTEYEPYFGQYKEVFKNYPHCTDNIVCWGDSLTYGTGSSVGGYPYWLGKLLPDRTIYTCGYPGDTSIEILGMSGALNMLVSPCTIPESGSVDIDIYDAMLSEDTPFRFPMIDSATGVNPVEIGGILGNLDLSKTSNPDSRKFTFSRLEDGQSVTFTDYEKMITSVGKKRKSDIMIIFIGTNGGWENNNEYLINQIKTMVDNQDSFDKKYIIVGITAGYTELRKSLEKDMLIAFGEHYVNMRDYLVRCGLSENGLTPTSTDDSDISVGRVPKSLRYDDTHLNDFGYKSVANRLYKQGRLLGYWS